MFVVSKCRCAGVYFEEAGPVGAQGIALTAQGCRLIFGNPELGRFIRGMLRTDVNKLAGGSRINGDPAS
jgi:hypothetical protein